jgi:hypothetical protein
MMNELARRLAVYAFSTRYSRGAIPGLFPNYQEDPRALATDRRFKKWARVAGFLGARLEVLAALCGTDKFGPHHYTPVYETLMSLLRRRRITLLELGVGGFGHSLGGESLLMWAAYFRRGRIFGIDIEDKTSLSNDRVKVLQCSQADRDRLAELAGKIGPFDFVIDDGSHVNAHQIASFQVLWPYVRHGGAYVVEDVQTSYWPAFGGGALGSPGYERSCMAYFRSLADGVNAPEFLDPPKAGFDPSIGSVAFHHNLIVITKDTSVRSSNLALDNEAVRSVLMNPAGIAMQ